MYLCVVLNRNGGFANAKKKRNAQRGLKATYELLKKGKLHKLSVSCQYSLFCSIVKSILMYGCEVWGFNIFECVEGVHSNFCKLAYYMLNSKRTTPSYMIYSE